MKKLLEVLVTVVLVAALPGVLTDKAAAAAQARKADRIAPVSKLVKTRIPIPGGRISVTLM